MHTRQPGAVRAGLDEPQGGHGGVGEHEVCVLVRVDLHHAHSIVNQIPVRGLQLPHLVCAGFQLGQVNFTVDVGGKLLPVGTAHLFELKADIGQGTHRHAVHLYQMDARFQAVEENKGLRPGLSGLQLDLLGRGSDHMGVIRGHLLHQIGAGFQIIQENLAVPVRSQGVKQRGVLVNFKGNAGEPVPALLVHLDDPQGGFALVGNSYHGIILDSGVVGIDVYAVRRLVQDIPSGGGGLHHFDIGFFPDAGHAGFACIIGGDRSDKLPIRKHIKGSPRERHAGFCVYFDNGNADIPHILPGDGHILGAVPFHRFHAGGLHIAIRG